MTNQVPNAVLKLASKAKGAGAAQDIVRHWKRFGRVPENYINEYFDECMKEAKQNLGSFGEEKTVRGSGPEPLSF